MRHLAGAEPIARLSAAAMCPATADGLAGGGTLLWTMEAEEPRTLQLLITAIRTARRGRDGVAH